MRDYSKVQTFTEDPTYGNEKFIGWGKPPDNVYRKYQGETDWHIVTFLDKGSGVVLEVVEKNPGKEVQDITYKRPSFLYRLLVGWWWPS